MAIETRPSASVPVWAETGDTVQPTNPEISIGWPPTTTPPSRQRFNWILNWCARGLRYLLQRGISEWAAAETYPQYAKVTYTDGLVYRALIASPTSAPNAVAGEWEVFGYSDSTIQPRVDRYQSVSVAGGSDVTITTAQAEAGILVLTGLLTANINVILPNVARRRVVKNTTTGAYTVTLKCPSSGATLGVNQGQSVFAYTDGSNNVYGAGSSDLANAVLLSGGQTMTGLLNLFTGSTAPTATTGTNSTVLASTAFVQQEIGAKALGVGQTWQDFTGSRAQATTYTNTTGRPIVVDVSWGGTGTVVNFQIDGVTVKQIQSAASGGTQTNITAIIAAGSTYNFNVTGVTISKWFELR